MSFALTVSSAALAELKRLAEQWDMPSGSFRLGVRSGGCRTFTYQLELNTEPRPGDQIVQGEEWSAVIHHRDLAYLRGLSLDYSEDLVGGNFRFQNPNAQHLCSCGHSFDIANGASGSHSD
ncbi:MAG: iron-sulfur cluster assembly accessory protein [Oscillatoriales cyanobacterium]|nr:MAG: iron-sulfur cluster assembly accessory protein [Oscillatoriales cyanobacterium]